jgi:hypothetical protein
VGTAITAVALSDTSWMKHPEVLDDPARGRVQLAPVPLPSTPFFAGFRFFAVTDPTEKPGTAALIVVANNGAVRSVRSLDDFNQVIAATGRSISSGAGASDVAEAYVRTLGTTYPQYPQSVHILQSADEIPLRPGETLPPDLRAQIHPPSVEQADEGFDVRLSVWTEVGGALTSYRFRISPSGIVAVDETTLGQGIGTHWLPK